MSAVQLHRVAKIAKRLGVRRVTFYSYLPLARARSQARPEG